MYHSTQFSHEGGGSRNAVFPVCLDEMIGNLATQGSGGGECPILPFTGEMISYRCFTGSQNYF